VNVFISGVSSGLGAAMADLYLEQHSVFGLSRRAIQNPNIKHVCCDLAELNSISKYLDVLFNNIDHLDLVILNAGQLGPIETLKNQSIDSMQKLMDVNLWSNKVLCDFLLERFPQLSQVVLISSGASINGYAGWGGYSLSKAALNMLAKIYASENPTTHFCSLAPGLIDTPMQDYLCEQVDPEDFPSVQRLSFARQNGDIPNPQKAAHLMASVIKKIKGEVSGSYCDVRKF
jgi:benzil reductase ((S)-benzoin forming)